MSLLCQWMNKSWSWKLEFALKTNNCNIPALICPMGSFIHSFIRGIYSHQNASSRIKAVCHSNKIIILLWFLQLADWIFYPFSTTSWTSHLWSFIYHPLNPSRLRKQRYSINMGEFTTKSTQTLPYFPHTATLINSGFRRGFQNRVLRLMGIVFALWIPSYNCQY